MNDINPLIINASQKVVLTSDEQNTLAAAFETRRIRKRQLLVQPEFTAKYRFYIVKGAFRAFVVNERGVDLTVQFAIDDWWITDYNSYIYQRPATLFIEALEDGVVMQIDYDTEANLKRTNHNYETLFRMMAEKSAAFYVRRMVAMHTQSAEQRYEEFLDTYPAVAQRLPQYVLASYLNMTTEFLSKIRNNKLPSKMKTTSIKKT